MNMECNLWTGHIGKEGYGLTYLPGCGTVSAHRLAYCQGNGLELEDIKGLHVCHKCDVRHCVNPDHLFLGTHQDNMDDMVAKGRQRTPRGEKHGSCKLSDKQVVEIRELYATGQFTQAVIARRFRVHQSNISHIVRFNTRGVV